MKGWRGVGPLDVPVTPEKRLLLPLCIAYGEPWTSECAFIERFFRIVVKTLLI